MQESSEARATIWSAFIMGAAVGVVIGMLLAPKSGRETRQIVGERMGQARARLDQARAAVQSRMGQVRERVRRAREPEASE
jgi:gas vesicle protein